MREPLLIAAIIALFCIVFPLFWLGVTGLLGALAGWNRLAARFPDRPEQTPIETLSARSGSFGLVNYNNCLTLAACPLGLRISVMRLVGPFQKPFFVPWSDIAAKPRRLLWLSRVRLRFGDPAIANLDISRRTFDFIAARSPAAIRAG